MIWGVGRLPEWNANCGQTTDLDPGQPPRRDGGSRAWPSSLGRAGLARGRGRGAACETVLWPVGDRTVKCGGSQACHHRCARDGCAGGAETGPRDAGSGSEASCTVTSGPSGQLPAETPVGVWAPRSAVRSADGVRRRRCPGSHGPEGPRALVSRPLWPVDGAPRGNGWFSGRKGMEEPGASCRAGERR